MAPLRDEEAGRSAVHPWNCVLENRQVTKTGISPYVGLCPSQKAALQNRFRVTMKNKLFDTLDKIRGK